MLIEFSVTNFRSIQSRQTLSLTKSKLKESNELEQNTFMPSGLRGLGLLRSAAIYGPNAAGKSNLLRALRIMEEVVLKSASKWQRGDAVPVDSFKLDPQAAKAPTEFEVSFIVQGVRYQYGFAATQAQVIEEWLIAYPKVRAQHWFARRWNENKGEYDWELSNALQGQKQLWQESTRSNALFLSTAVQLNSQQLQPVFDWFKNTLRTITVTGWGPGFTALMCNEPTNKARVLSFLRAADIDIYDVLIKNKIFDADDLPDNIPDEVKAMIAKKLEGKELAELTMLHLDSTGQPIPLDFEDESEGTQKLFSFAGPWIDVLKNGYVLFIDELHDNLHPKLVQFLVELFHSDETNPNNAQLIFTTHETSILNQEVFRRDQIWFCEKNDHRSTTLFPLTDFSPRRGRENLEMAYLAGRYGALPYMRKLKTV